MSDADALLDKLQELANACKSLSEQLAELKAQALVDQDLLAALIVCHPNPQTLRSVWQEASSATHADRTVRRWALRNADHPLAGANQRVQTRMAHWGEVIDLAIWLREDEAPSP